MNKPSSYFFLFLLTVFIACGQAEPNTETVEPPEVTEAPMMETPAPNQDNTAIYDVDDDDPYLISNGQFLGMMPGTPLADFEAGLRKGTLKTGEGEFDVFYIDGAEGQELGYLLTDPRDASTIGDIHITSTDVVTEEGIRVGVNFEELQNRLGRPLEVHGSEVEGRTYANKDKLKYRLKDEAHFSYELEANQIKPNSEVMEIVIGR